MPEYSIGRYGAIQVGKQTALGTAATLTREMFGEAATYNDEKEQVNFENATGGGISSPRITPVRGSNQSTINWPMSVDPNGIWLPLQMLMGDGVKTTPTYGVGNTPAPTARQYEWTVEPDEGTPRNYYSFGMIKANDEPTQVDYQDFIPDVFCESLTIASAANGVPQATAVYRGNAMTRQDNVLTTPTLIEPAIIANKRYIVTIDDDWAAMQANTTPELDVYGFNIVINSGLSVAPQADGRQDLGYSQVTRMGLTMTITLNAYVGTDAASFVREEVAHHAANDRRFISVRGVGDIIDEGTADADANFSVIFGGSMVHTGESMSSWMTYDDGSRETVDLQFSCIFDPTSGNDIWVRLLNGLDTLP